MKLRPQVMCSTRRRCFPSRSATEYYAPFVLALERTAVSVLSLLNLKQQQTIELPAGEEARAITDAGNRVVYVATRTGVVRLDMLAKEAQVDALFRAHRISEGFYLAQYYAKAEAGTNPVKLV